MESMQAGLSELVGAHKQKIVAAVGRQLSVVEMQFPVHNPYGDGRASERILKVLR